jgi:hypothetical protein
MERARLESAAANYVALRGLLMIPTGILIIVAALSNLEWGPFRHLWTFWATAAVAVTASLLILRHYNGTYGRITPSTRTRMTAAAWTLVTVAVTVGWMQVTWSLNLPLSGSTILFAGIIVVQYALSRVRLRRHHLIASGALLIAGLIPVWGGLTPDTRFSLGMILGGTAITVVGIFDHVALKRAFTPTMDLNHDLDHGNADVDA